MPLRWEIASEDRLVTTMAEGEVSSAEVEEYFDMLDQTGFHSWRKLVDATEGHTSMDSNDIMMLAARIRRSHERFEVGPLAIVAQEEKMAPFTRMLGILASANRAMRVFRRLEEARTWLLKQPLAAQRKRPGRPSRPWVLKS